jgi:dTDP-4-dehydrorhamnose 3,5-epimerase
MIFRETKLPGAFIIEVQRLEGDRGFWGRSLSRPESSCRGLNLKVVQRNISLPGRPGPYGGCIIRRRPMPRPN